MHTLKVNIPIVYIGDTTFRLFKENMRKPTVKFEKAADVGDVSQPVREGKNGFLLPHDATAEEYAEKIKSVFNDIEKYIELRKSSRKEYEKRLNRDVWAERVNKILDETVAKFK